MATFNGGRVVALFLCVLFVASASFAQEPEEVWDTVVLYMVDPINERLAPEVEEYIDKWNDPLTWETFERDFTPARDAQMAQVDRENRARKQAAREHLLEDLRTRGDGTSSWYPSWIPLGAATTMEDSLFKNILSLPGRTYDTDERAGQNQLLVEFFELDGTEPYGLNSDGSQRFRACEDRRRRCRKEFYANFRELVEIHDASQVSATAPRVISFTIQVKSSRDRTPVEFGGFVDELNEQVSAEPGTATTYADFNWESIRLLQPAAMDPDPYLIDSPVSYNGKPYWHPAAKPVSSTEASSWGRIKATFAD